MTTRDRILLHALDLIALSGEATFSIREIGDDLDLSSGSMFHAYSSRNSLLAACFAAAIRRYHDAVIEVMELDDLTDALDGWIARHLAWVEENEGLARFLFSSTPSDVAAETTELLLETNDRFADAQSRLFSRICTAGMVGDVDRRLAHSLSLGPAQEHCRKWLNGTADKPTASLITLQQAAWSALASTVSGTPSSSPATDPASRPPRGRAVATYQGVVFPTPEEGAPRHWLDPVLSQATTRFLALVGLTPIWLTDQARAIKLSEQAIRYRAEPVATTCLEVTTRLVESTTNGLRFEHLVVDSFGDRTIATATVSIVLVEAESRRTTVLPETTHRAVSDLDAAAAD